MCGGQSASFSAFNPCPEPWSRRSQDLRMGEPGTAELKSLAQGHLTCKYQSWDSGTSFGSL